MLNEFDEKKQFRVVNYLLVIDSSQYSILKSYMDGQSLPSRQSQYAVNKNYAKLKSDKRIMS